MSDLNLINTLQLKIFVTVAEERTLKAAAVKNRSNTFGDQPKHQSIRELSRSNVIRTGFKTDSAD